MAQWPGAPHKVKVTFLVSKVVDPTFPQNGPNSYSYRMRIRFTRCLCFIFIFLNCWHFFEVWQHSFDVVRYIFERGLFSREGKSYAYTVFVLIYQ